MRDCARFLRCHYFLLCHHSEEKGEKKEGEYYLLTLFIKSLLLPRSELALCRHGLLHPLIADGVAFNLNGDDLSRWLLLLSLRPNCIPHDGENSEELMEKVLIKMKRVTKGLLKQ